MNRQVLVPLLATLAPIALAWTGLWVTLGAHPAWAVQSAVIGATIGALTVFAPLADANRMRLGLVLALLAALTAVLGRTRFVASFAEDTVSGRLWYLGWCGVGLGLAVLCAGIAGWALSRHR